MFVSSGGGKELRSQSPKATGEYKSIRWDVPHSHCLACALMISSPPSNAKYVMELDVMAEESARLNSSRVHKLVRVSRKETEKLRNTPRLSLGSYVTYKRQTNICKTPRRYNIGSQKQKTKHVECIEKHRNGYHWAGDLVSDELLPEDLVRGPLPRRIQDVPEDPGPRLRHPLQRRRRQQAHPPCLGLPFRMCVRPPKPTYPLRRPSSTGHPKILGPPNTPCPFAH
ncbi:hypothetical protein B296_00004245 [Ensete ventricosum]|uniref:Uncharacterized protein n=1 Tax=Ensete ventricosum TaxID=4639 RepID=A0A427B503_ENSVE|nr:hypothetical protein B296_00004245 [Ensete ventricosum]